MPCVPLAGGRGEFVLLVFPIFRKNHQEQQYRGGTYLGGVLRCVVPNRALSRPLLEEQEKDHDGDDERLLRAAP